MKLSRILSALFCSLLLGETAHAIVESNGFLDPQFNAGNFTNGHVSSVIVQPDGKFLVGGLFAKANGVARCDIARFNANGTLDTSFDPGTGLDGDPTGMILQSDGKIIVYGGFYSVNGTSRNASIARLNSDGLLDDSFDPGAKIFVDSYGTFGGSVLAAVLQPDGKLIVAGRFSYVFPAPGEGSFRSGIARFNSDGSFDGSFDAANLFAGPDGPNETTIAFVARQKVGANAGKLIIAGSFDNYDSSITPGIIRLNPDGSHDGTFGSILGDPASVPLISGLFAQSDDKIIVYGGFTTFNGVTCSGISRLATNGAQDTSFSTGAFKNYANTAKISAVAQQSNGKLVVSGTFHSIDGTSANNLARLLTNGTRDSAFDTSAGGGPLCPDISALAVRASDQETVVGGTFTTYGNTSRNNIALVKLVGTLDTAFAPSGGLIDGDTAAYASAVQPDGKVILGGSFTLFEWRSRLQSRPIESGRLARHLVWDRFWRKRRRPRDNSAS